LRKRRCPVNVYSFHDGRFRGVLLWHNERLPMASPSLQTIERTPFTGRNSPESANSPLTQKLSRSGTVDDIHLSLENLPPTLSFELCSGEAVSSPGISCNKSIMASLDSGGVFDG
jgi:hypothetical protein